MFCIKDILRQEVDYILRRRAFLASCAILVQLSLAIIDHPSARETRRGESLNM